MIEKAQYLVKKKCSTHRRIAVAQCAEDVARVSCGEESLR